MVSLAHTHTKKAQRASNYKHVHYTGSCTGKYRFALEIIRSERMMLSQLLYGRFTDNSTTPVLGNSMIGQFKVKMTLLEPRAHSYVTRDDENREMCHIQRN